MKKIINPQYNLKAFLYLIPLSFGICVIGNIAASFFPFAADNEVSKEVMEMLNNGELLKALLMVGIIAPIVEELIFRLFLYYIFKRFFNYKVAIIATAILFAVAHMNIEQGVYALFAGLFLAYVRYKYNSIFCPIFMHLLMNVIVVVFADYFNRNMLFTEKLYMLMIGVVILLLSIYRINIIFKERR